MNALGLDEGIIRGTNYTLLEDTGRLVRRYETNAGADVSTILHERHLYFRRYKEGTHMVIVEKIPGTEDQYGLVTQYAGDPAAKFGEVVVELLKEGHPGHVEGLRVLRIPK